MWENIEVELWMRIWKLSHDNYSSKWLLQSHFVRLVSKLFLMKVCVHQYSISITQWLEKLQKTGLTWQRQKQLQHKPGCLLKGTLWFYTPSLEGKGLWGSQGVGNTEVTVPHHDMWYDSPGSRFHSTRISHYSQQTLPGCANMCCVNVLSVKPLDKKTGAF